MVGSMFRVTCLNLGYNFMSDGGRIKTVDLSSPDAQPTIGIMTYTNKG
jgi:hypothetical protein